MQTNLLIIYSSVDGQTLKICNALAEQLKEQNQPVEIYSIDTFNKDLKPYDKIVIGSSIRYGVHNKKIIDFINSHKEELEAKKSVFFSVNLVARKPEKSTPTENPYVVKFFKTIDWKPTLVEVFAGKIDYKKYNFFDRKMIQLIMWMTHGPTNKDAEIEYTNWEKVKSFGLKLIDL
ncbi:menaquinone-dependent protoporphyrinogen IX dehydrogenase [Yeosuana sp.]|uniref:menaquinone-dependent protoporphyrinogen IX dehydrogenase n=1 Tax=Yeosuana sp. TaxID=2529388 RepID=UPI00405526A8|tara:strand:- start:2472 stop:2999 length:528 start_codon:yes stop_codon:yes gene_type:complete